MWYHLSEADSLSKEKQPDAFSLSALVLLIGLFGYPALLRADLS
jgi:hypothetical protein